MSTPEGSGDHPAGPAPVTGPAPVAGPAPVTGPDRAPGTPGPAAALRGPASGLGLPAQRTEAGHRDRPGSAVPDPQGPDGAAGRPADGRLKLLLVGSSGGHLAQLTALAPWSAAHDRHWVCFDTPDAVSILAAEQVTWAHHPTTRHLPNLVRNLVLAWRVLRRERPDVVLSTGAGVALPFFVLARLTGVPTVYLEVYDRIDSATLTGRLCRPFATRMLVQWEEQRPLYRGAEVVGCVL